jgi:formylglycine-generating enzyme required for sulfatase activity
MAFLRTFGARLGPQRTDPGSAARLSVHRHAIDWCRIGGRGSEDHSGNHRGSVSAKRLLGRGAVGSILADAHAAIGKQPIAFRHRSGNIAGAKIFGSESPSCGPDVDSIMAEKKTMQSRTAQSEKEITNSIGMKLALIPKGTFMMGSPESEKGSEANEVQHEVTLRKDFYLGVTAVTQAQYQTVMGYNCSDFQGDVTGSKFLYHSL